MTIESILGALIIGLILGLLGKLFVTRADPIKLLFFEFFEVEKLTRARPSWRMLFWHWVRRPASRVPSGIFPVISVVTADGYQRMADDAMVFAMANPTPEVSPEEAAQYARIVATGRSDYPNQINNVLCFPGIFRGALDVRARAITEEMKMAAGRAIAEIIPESELREDYIIPSVFNRDVAPAVAAAVAERAKQQGAATVDGDTIGFAAIDAERMRAG